MSLIIISCRKTSVIMPLKLSWINLLGFVPFLVLLSHLFFPWVLRLNSCVGPVGSTVSKPILTSQSLALSCTQRPVPRGFAAFLSQIWSLYFAFSIFSVS